MILSHDQIKKVAELARLELSEEEMDKYGNQLSAVLEYIEQLNEVDTSNVAPTAQVTGLVNSWRDDEIVNWDKEEREATLAQAPDSEEHQVKVKRVL